MFFKENAQTTPTSDGCTFINRIRHTVLFHINDLEISFRLTLHTTANGFCQQDPTFDRFEIFHQIWHHLILLTAEKLLGTLSASLVYALSNVDYLNYYYDQSINIRLYFAVLIVWERLVAALSWRHFKKKLHMFRVQVYAPAVRNLPSKRQI